MDWIARVKTLPVAEVALGLGLQGGRNGYGPCPACGAVRRGSGYEKRPPIGLRQDGQGWACHACKVTGDGPDLVARVLEGLPLSELDHEGMGKVRSWYATRGACPPEDFSQDRPWRPDPARWRAALPEQPPPPPDPAEPTPRPPSAEVAALWTAGRRVDAELPNPTPSDLEVSSFLARRAFFPMALAALDLVRVTPLPDHYTWPRWWPRSWSNRWRLVVRMFEPDGTFASLHARNVTQQGPKTMSPKGAGIGGLFMADPAGLGLLRQDPPDGLRGVLICEGLTDFLRASLLAADGGFPLAVLSGVSGSFRALVKVRWPKGLRVYVATDPDEAGERYALEIGKILVGCPVQVKRYPLGGNHGET